MILVRLMGGLGNQMFQYATAYALALRHNSQVKIDTTLLEYSLKLPHDEITHRYLDLDVFDIKLTSATVKEIQYFNGKQYNSIFGKAYNKLLVNLRKEHLVLEKGRGFNPEIIHLSENKCLVGAWQSPEYFSDKEDQIRTLFTFKEPISDVSKELYLSITTSESICVFVRRGDYVTSPIYSKTIGAKGAAYFNEGIKLLENKFTNGKIFVFSDDLEWCKKNLSSNLPFYFVGDEHAGEKYGNKLHLMSVCKHFVISNSTYSWWGAWLSKNKEKIVVAPKTWALDPLAVPNDILPKNWKLLDY